MSTNVLTLDFAVGYNKDIKNGVLSLITDSRKALVYVAAHTAVIYDIDTGSQQLLQGHCNPISCVCVSRDRKWIFTADSGPDSMIIVWNSESGVPVKNIFSPHPEGVIAMDLSPDSTTIATLSAPYPIEQTSTTPLPTASTHFPRDAFDAQELSGIDDDMATLLAPQSSSSSAPFRQEIALWDWIADDSEPRPSGLSQCLLCLSPICTGDVQHHIVFNPTNPDELCTTGKRRTVFWKKGKRRLVKKGGKEGDEEHGDDEGAEDEEEENGNRGRDEDVDPFHKLPCILHYHSPALNTRDLHQDVSSFTASAFFPFSDQAVTATDNGDFILWSSMDGKRETDTFLDDLDDSQDESDNEDDGDRTQREKKGGESKQRFHIAARKVMKILRLNPSSTSSPCLVTHPQFFITGDEDGNVRFFDFQFRLCGWFEDLNLGPLSSLSLSVPASFDSIHDFVASTVKDSASSTSTSTSALIASSSTSVAGVTSAGIDLNPRTSVLPDLIVGTTLGKVLLVKGSSFADDTHLHKKFNLPLVPSLGDGGSGKGMRGMSGGKGSMKDGSGAGMTQRKGKGTGKEKDNSKEPEGGKDKDKERDRLVRRPVDQHGRGEKLLDGQSGSILCVAMHPFLPLIAIGNSAGVLTLVMFQSKEESDENEESERSQSNSHDVPLPLFQNGNLKREIIGEKQFEKAVTAVQFDPTGKYLAVGFKSGMLKMLIADYGSGSNATSTTTPSGAALSQMGIASARSASSAKLDSANGFPSGVNAPVYSEHWTFKSCSDSVMEMKFSPDGMFMAMYDADRYVVLYRKKKEGEEVSPDELLLSEDGDWVTVGRNRAHRKEIRGIEFGISSQQQYVLFTIGSDRRLVLFDVYHSSVLNGFKTLSSFTIEQTAIPTACLFLQCGRPLPEVLLRVSAPAVGKGAAFTSTAAMMMNQTTGGGMDTYALGGPMRSSTSDIGRMSKGVMGDTLSGGALMGTTTQFGQTLSRTGGTGGANATGGGPVAPLNPDFFRSSGIARAFGSIGPGDVILIANSEFKFKFLDFQTMQVRRVVQAPIFGQNPVNRFITFPSVLREFNEDELSASPLDDAPKEDDKDADLEEDDEGKLDSQRDDDSARASSSRRVKIGGIENRGEKKRLIDLSRRYVGYTTSSQMVGLIRLPLDGNQLNGMGLIAHPGAVMGAVITHNGSHLLTIGGEDCTLFGWSIDVNAMETLCALQNSSVTDPILAQLEGGPGGPLHNEIINMFYYAQLRSQGEDATVDRAIEGAVPLSQVPNLLRGVGFYPTEKEINDVIADLEWSGREKDEAGQVPTSVGLSEFIRVFVNHRPIMPPSQEDVDDAFKKLGAEPLTGVISRDSLLNLLMTTGEPIPPEMLAECLNILTKKPMTELKENLTSLDFSRDILGFNDADEQMEDEEQPNEG
ncbi:putative flagellar associated protein [Monocercomonoides exilis]|uniref:putative flagellar associated protein n=1 Tax=Monocercomonoides exilis TaxID=2049356 RepID=UPI003559D353|nr:putative flagellar associated protein [Monocercomonoides exilis]|eukprot:MONOS_5108.1-p1 / transcript=MONOS_5108.1 / gene=MONOS_5108 / organism=Monocercomonoides_exilis_PA203 / gene_product=flagellar associated protein / transcript_product=flagellar associated protein / location=Mono_scaffold00145:38340-42963(+) / protein_length=1408 / sequence_SO=supercontig / SO=protein_coding / is_pseudo=false